MTTPPSNKEYLPISRSSGSPHLIFGIYPGGRIAGASSAEAGKPNDPARIEEALARLQDTNRPFLVREYMHYVDRTSDRSGEQAEPSNFLQYAHGGREIDLVLSYTSPHGDVEGWIEYILDMVGRYGSKVGSLQITEEPNLTFSPIIDGHFPRVREALVRGVIAAKKEAKRLGFKDLKIGFSAAMTFDPKDDFWSAVGILGGPEFVQSLDYVGLDFFLDVFWPVQPTGQPGDLRHSVVGVLQAMRESWMPAANIPFSVPLRICENGWPTGPSRSAEQQAKTIETIVRTIDEYRGNFNIMHYELFDLRDANSSSASVFHQFGLLGDDYTPKPAFEVYRGLVKELGKP